MEDNNTTPEGPTPCTAGCGFYGNMLYNNMCSKCFKELDSQNKKDIKEEEEEEEQVVTLKDISKDQPSIQASVKTPTVIKEEEIKVVVVNKQKNKGRCFNCRSKIPLAKQLTNKCRCELVFCDTHRYPDKHDCNFDHAKNDKDILAKNNPKLHDKPRGGNSFQRIDSL